MCSQRVDCGIIFETGISAVRPGCVRNEETKKDLRHLQDPQQRAAAAELKEAKKKPVQRISTSLCGRKVTQDFSIRDAQQKRLPAPPGANAFHHVIGALNWRSQELAYTLVKTKARPFRAIICWRSPPQKRIVLVMDNAGIASRYKPCSAYTRGGCWSFAALLPNAQSNRALLASYERHSHANTLTSR